MTTQVSIAENAAERNAGERETRQVRAKRLFRNGAFERLSAYVWIVENPKRGSVHRVDLVQGSCDCEDHRRHGHMQGFSCYHRLAVESYVDWLKKTARACIPYFTPYFKDAG